MDHIMKYIFLALISVTALLMTGCGKDSLTDEELTDLLVKCYDRSFEITKKPSETTEEKKSGLYYLKCSDGTEFTVQREWKNDFIGGHYEYTENYVPSWIFDHPELYSELTNSDLVWEQSIDGFTLEMGSYDDIVNAVGIACKLANDIQPRLPVRKDIESVFLYHIRPGISFTGKCFESKDPEISLISSKDTEYLINRGWFPFFDSGVDIVYDTDDITWQIEQKYTDMVRDKEIAENLPEEVFEKFGPKRLIVDIGDLKRRNISDEFIDRVPERSIYYIHAECEINKHGEEQPPNFAYIAMWAAQAGYVDKRSDVGYYSISDGSSTVTFHVFPKSSRSSFPYDRVGKLQSDCYVEKDGVRVELQGGVYSFYQSNYEVYLTTDDLKALFGLEFEFDYINGKAEIINK